MLLRASLAAPIAVAPLTLAGEQTFADPDYLITTFDTNDGMPENSATAIVQTPDGYLLFGTFAGLVKFDGVRCSSWIDPSQAAARGPGVVNLHLDQHDRVWVSDYERLSIIDNQEVRGFSARDGWTGDFVKSFAERDDGDLLITTYDHRIFEFSGGAFRELPPPDEVASACFAFVDETNQWWIARRSFFGRWNGSEWVSAFTIPPHRSFGCCSAHDGGIWLLIDQLLLKFHDGREVMRRTLSEHPGGPWQLFEDTAGNVWVATYDNGVCRIDPSGNVRRWTTGRGLNRPSTRFVFEDQERNIWVGTSGGGLVRFAPRRFAHIGARQGLPPFAITSSCPDRDGSHLIATYGKGVLRWDGERLHPVRIRGYEEAHELYIQSVLVDRSCRTWIGAYMHGLFLIDGNDQRQIASQQIGGANVIALFEDSKGRIWISSGENVAIFDDGGFRIISKTEGELRGIHAFAEDAEHRIWFFGEIGLFRFDDEKITPIPLGAVIAPGDVRGIAADRNGSIWRFGRESLGRWNAQTNAFEHLRLPFGFVHGLVQDESNRYWLATSDGIVRVEARSLLASLEHQRQLTEYHIFDQSDGLESLEFVGARQPVHSIDAQGRLWFTTSSGIVVTDPSTIRLNDQPPRVAIEAIRAFDVNNEELFPVQMDGANPLADWRRQSGSGRIELPPECARVEIQYTALSFTAPEKVRFQSMLEGRDAAWRDAGDQRTAVIERLDPGDFVFRVRAANNDGMLNEQGVAVAFTFAPFFWQTFWFRSAAIFAAASALAGIAWRAGYARHQRRARSNDWFRRVVQAAPNAIIAVDTGGTIRFVNQQIEAVFGYAHHELIGIQIESLIPERFRNQHKALRQQFVLHPSTRAMGAGHELFGRRKDGSEFPVEIGLSTLEGPDGTLVLASIVDISERRRARAEADRQRSELTHMARVAMLGELSASFAHELNQPLTAILSNTQAAQRFLAMDHANLQEIREILNEIVDDNNRASEVIRRMRALFRKGELAFEPVHLPTLIERVVRLLRSDSVLRQVVIVVACEQNMPPVQADAVQIQQVLLNLLLNAFEAMEQTEPETRRVEIRAAAQDSMVCVSVGDSGPGLPADKMNQVFEPFVTTKRDGLGMGLSICRSIIEAHGGKIHAANLPVGGALFSFTLPMSQEVAAQTTHSTS